MASLQTCTSKMVPCCSACRLRSSCLLHVQQQRFPRKRGCLDFVSAAHFMDLPTAHPQVSVRPSCRPGLTLTLLRAAARQTIKASPFGQHPPSQKTPLKTVQRTDQHRAPAGSSRDQPPALRQQQRALLPPAHTSAQYPSRRQPTQPPRHTAKQRVQGSPPSSDSTTCLTFASSARQHQQAPTTTPLPDATGWHARDLPARAAAVPWTGSAPGR